MRSASTMAVCLLRPMQRLNVNLKAVLTLRPPCAQVFQVLNLVLYNIIEVYVLNWGRQQLVSIQKKNGKIANIVASELEII